MCNLVNKAGAVVDISDVHPVCSLLPVICERPPVGVSTTSSKLSLWWFFHQWWLFSSQVQNPSVSIHIDIKIHCILMDLLFLILYIAGIGLLQWNYSYINYPISEYYISKYKSSLWSNLRNFVSMVRGQWVKCIFHLSSSTELWLYEVNQWWMVDYIICISFMHVQYVIYILTKSSSPGNFFGHANAKQKSPLIYCCKFQIQFGFKSP